MLLNLATGWFYVLQYTDNRHTFYLAGKMLFLFTVGLWVMIYILLLYFHHRD